MKTTRDKLIAAGVRNLHQFGYPDCNETNILADRLYSAFFKRMLEEHSGAGKADAEALLAEITATPPPTPARQGR